MKILISTSYGAFDAEMDKYIKLQPNFRLIELANNAGDPNEEMYIISPESDKHVQTLQYFRTRVNQPVNVNSGFRQYDYNSKIGGDSNSAHLLGLATDIKKLNGMDDNEVIDAWFASLIESGINQGAINIYPNYYHLESYSQDLFNYTKAFTIRIYTTDDQYKAMKEYYKYCNYFFMRVRK